MKKLGWLWGLGGFVFSFMGIGAMAQNYATPVRTSWTDDPRTTATVSWDTETESRGTVRYGTTTDYDFIARDGGGVHFHSITLRNLTPNTDYFYEASSSDGFVQTGRFWTAPSDKNTPLHFALHGDLQGGISIDGATQVSEAIIRENPKWVIQHGDLSDEAYGSSGFSTWTNFFNVCKTELASFVFMPIVGNHDNPDDALQTIPPTPSHPRGLYHRIFALPEPSLGNGYYAYTVGNTRFITLNTEMSAASEVPWLERELQAAANDPNITWIMGFCHRPPYSWGQRAGWENGKSNWCPTLTRYEADWFIGGHSHNYQRTIPIRGVRYLVNGGAGGSPYKVTTNAAELASLNFATQCWQYVSVHITNQVMQLRGIRGDGFIFDSCVVTNQRQVRVQPAFPRRGESARILYKATTTTNLIGQPSIHIGQDAFSSAFADAPMTWSDSDQAWVYDFVVPQTATQRVAFCFFDSRNMWENNYSNNWQAILGRVSLSSDHPVAGTQVIVRYEGDMGPIGTNLSTRTLLLWPQFRSASGAITPYAAEGIPMTKTSGSRYECALTIPANANKIILAFSAGSMWDDDYKRKWHFPVSGATETSWPSDVIASMGSPIVTDDPPNGAKNNVGDNFDLVMQGRPILSQDHVIGFGNWGQLWFNVDQTNLYVGGTGLDMGGTNNVFMLFLGLDTLTDNAWNLWHKSGLPNSVDFLHNLRFTEPMDLVIILGNQYGDRPDYTNFNFHGTGSYDYGQGVYYLSTNSSSFAPMTSARISQFDGTGTIPCATENDSGTDNRTTRWEVALPWSALGTTSLTNVSHLFVGGVLGSSSVVTNDRYLSRSYIGEKAWGRVTDDSYMRYGYYSVTLRPLRVNFPHGDLLGDGLSNAWRQEFFGTLSGPPADEDTDGDGMTNREEEIAWTDPTDPASIFDLSITQPNGSSVILQWPYRAERLYDVYASTNLLEGVFAPVATGLRTPTYSVDLPNGAPAAFYDIRVRK